MKPTTITSRSLLGLFALLSFCQQAAAQTPDISGPWVIHSSVGGATPITVRCELVQAETKLTGSCTPEMENPQPSELTGEITVSSAHLGYDVVFNGNAGRVDFTATSLSPTALAGTLSLSGTEAPFTAERK